ncbi:type II toxin-antitoxin system VapC family toxin [Candidatus Accumulibacter sp. ACC003]|uniref:type II toxin-antitoxin system VapC family toxin n=1 Tax=Candidatus Accumulibacter sp. ACC003 TaxID=2823334 RepID=UPI0025C051B5|nr:type II toxin-antitoxin system VapC family toxin [Candidatus Accumulibacter sp. ACC003]
MIVADTNIIAYLYLPSEFTAAAEALFERDHEWAAPILWRSEFRNILAGYMRRKALTFEQAMSIQQAAEDLLDGLEFEVVSTDVLELVKTSDCSAYDCEFVALAKKLDTRVVTMDGKLLRAFPGRTTPLIAG